MLRQFFTRKLKLLEAMDPKRIYVENVRHFLGVNERFARWLCEKATRDGFFEKWISYEHPEIGHIIVQTPANEPLEDRPYHDDVSELRELEQVEFTPSQMRQRVFYRAPIRS